MKVAYEWVFTFSKGDDQILTEKQYEFYKQRILEDDMRQMFFEDTLINPVFVVSAERRPAEYVKRKYKCQTCHGNGIRIDLGRDKDYKFPVCEVCEGTGVDLTQ